LTLRYHPDRNKEPGAEDRFKEIAEAYAVLSDPRKRAEYDQRGFERISPEDLFRMIDFGDLFGGLGFDLGMGEGGFFDRFFRRRPSGPPRGSNLEVDLQIPLSIGRKITDPFPVVLGSSTLGAVYHR
jgi:molecular chaperone DnaJ